MNNEDKEEELKKEAEEFGDICRVSLLDSYEGLVHKVTKSISCLESYHQGFVLIMDQPTFKRPFERGSNYFYLCDFFQGFQEVNPLSLLKRYSG